MNILIPHSWLLEQLETQVDPKTIQTQLSLCGPSVERIYEREGESVYDIEITTNRIDSLSVRGIAREAAVILSNAGHQSQLKPLTMDSVLANDQNDQSITPLPTINNNPEFCSRIICVVLDGVKHNPTPEWMAKRLRQIELNVHDAAIDITNYITHELGHPCHAFDYDKIMQLGGVINVVTATAGESFNTLDGESYTTVGGEVVFKNDHNEIIDLPAIKGTANTAVDDTTTRILFWIESLDAKKVRFASMSHAIRTVAAQLNEKNVDPYLAKPVIARGVQLYQELCEARVASELFDEFHEPATTPTINFEAHEIERYLGIKLPKEQVATILTDLGCQVTDQASTSLQITPPTFRPDLLKPVDLIEEVARIYGYHHLPSKLMDTAIPTLRQENDTIDLEQTIKHELATLGWQEVYTYSMVSATLAKQSGVALADHLKLQNPLTEDREYLRRSLIPSLNEVLDQNPQRSNVSVFELAFTYQPALSNIDLTSQALQLSAVSSQSYRQAKGILEVLLDRVHIAEYRFKKIEAAKPFHQTAAIMAAGQKIGQIGMLDQNRVGITIQILALAQVAKKYPHYQPIPKAAPILEDLTFTIPEKTAVGDLIETIKNSDPLVNSVKLSSEYQQNITLTITYLDPQQSISSEIVEPIRKKIVAQIEQQFQASLVGSV